MLPPHLPLSPSDDKQDPHTPPTGWQIWWGIRGIFVLIALVGCCDGFVKVATELLRIRQSQQRMHELHTDIASIESELVNLQAVIAHGDDTHYLEQLARQQGFVYPNETLVRSFDANDNPVIYSKP